MSKRARPAAASRGPLFEGSTLQRLLAVGVAAKLAGVVLLLDPLAADQFSLVKTVWSLAWSWLLLGILLLVLLRHGLAVVPRTRLHAAVAGVVAATALATLAAEDRFVAVFGAHASFLGALSVLDGAVLYAAVAVGIRTPRDARVVGGAAAGATLASILYALAQAAGLDPLAWNNPSQIRPIGTLGNPGPLGDLAVFGLGAAAGIGLSAALPRVRVAAAGFAAMCVLVVVVSSARSALVGCLAVAAVVGLIGGRRWLGTRRAGIAAALACAGLALVLVGTPFGARVTRTFTGGELADRALIYGMTLAATAQRPLLGWGPDNVVPATTAVRPADADRLFYGIVVDNAHSWPLQALVTTGVPGLAVQLLALGSALLVLWRSRTTSPVALPLLVGGVGFLASGLTSVGSPATAWIPWLVLGGAASCGARPAAEGASRRWTRGAWRSVVAVTTAAAFAGAVAAVPPLAASHALFAATRSLAEGHADQAVAHARDAVARDTGRVGGWLALGSALYAVERYREAGDALAEAAKRTPYDATLWVNLAKARAQQVAVQGDLTRGGASAALDAARKAVAVAPSSADAHAGLADVEARVGDPARALEMILRAFELYSLNPSYDAIAVLAAGRVADFALVRDRLTQMITLREGYVLRLGLARACLAANDTACVRREAERVIVLHPEDAEAEALLRQVNLAR